MKLYEIERKDGTRSKYKTFALAFDSLKDGDVAIYEGEWKYVSEYGMTSPVSHARKLSERMVWNAPEPNEA